MLEEMIEEVIRNYKKYKELGDFWYASSVTTSLVQLTLDSLYTYFLGHDKTNDKIVKLPKKPYIRRNDKRRIDVSRFI